MIAIYRLSSFLFLLASLFSVAMAQTSTDLNSYCFDKSVNLGDVQQSLKVLLLPKDIVEFRIEDNCLDIVTSPDRGKLFEKYLGKRYDLKRDARAFEKESLAIKDQDCRLDLKTTKKTKIDASNLKIGKKNVLNIGKTTNESVSTMELLLGAGKTGEMRIGEEAFKVICHLIGSESANLIFSYAEKDKASVNSEVVVKKGEWTNIASVLKDLSDKRRTMGVPLSEMTQTIGKSETEYELLFK